MKKPYKSRRDFIREMALGGSAAFLLTAPWLKVFAGEEKIASSAVNKLNIGVIGTGSRGTELMKNFFPVITELNVNIRAICDNFPLHLKKAYDYCKSNGTNPVMYNDYRKMLEKEKLDGVIIATPLNEHAHITVDCLSAGIHVFCEKAMARTLPDVKRMYDAPISTGKTFQIGHQRLFNPIYLEGMQKIGNGDLGQIGQIRAYWHRNNNWRRPLPNNDKSLDKKINWRLYKDESAGLLTELMSHQLHVANWVMGQMPVSVTGTGSIVFWKDGRSVPDNVALIFTYPDGVQFIYDSMISNKKYGLEEQVMGSKGTIEFEVNRYYHETPPLVPGIRQLLSDIEHGIFDPISVGGSSWIPETAVPYKGERIQPEDLYSDTQLELEAFVKFIRGGNFPTDMARDAYYGSIWTLLGELAIDSSQRTTIPEKYIVG